MWGQQNLRSNFGPKEVEEIYKKIIFFICGSSFMIIRDFVVEISQYSFDQEYLRFEYFVG